MPAEIINCDQGSPEWFEARRGIPTASEFHTVLAKGEGKTRRSYMLKLAGEIITGTVADGYSNAHMERGKDMEADARAEYEFMTDRTVEGVGFIRNGRAGASPDGLILSGQSLIEIKTKLPHLLIDTILKGDLPTDHRAQCQGALWVAEKDHLDFVAYWPGLPLFVKPVFRDETYIATLADEVARFNDELDAVVERVRSYRSAA
jgi:hypothetical protein